MGLASVYMESQRFECLLQFDLNSAQLTRAPSEDPDVVHPTHSWAVGDQLSSQAGGFCAARKQSVDRLQDGIRNHSRRGRSLSKTSPTDDGIEAEDHLGKTLTM